LECGNSIARAIGGRVALGSYGLYAFWRQGPCGSYPFAGSALVSEKALCTLKLLPIDIGGLA